MYVYDVISQVICVKKRIKSPQKPLVMRTDCKVIKNKLRGKLEKCTCQPRVRVTTSVQPSSSHASAVQVLQFLPRIFLRSCEQQSLFFGYYSNRNTHTTLTHTPAGYWTFKAPHVGPSANAGPCVSCCFRSFIHFCICARTLRPSVQAKLAKRDVGQSDFEWPKSLPQLLRMMLSNLVVSFCA